MAGPSLIYSAEILSVGFVIAFLGSLLPQLSRLKRGLVRVTEECFLRSFTALAVMTPIWITSNAEPLWPWTVGLLVALLGIKPSAVLIFAAQKGLPTILEAMVQASTPPDRPARPRGKPDDSSLV